MYLRYSLAYTIERIRVLAVRNVVTAFAILSIATGCSYPAGPAATSVVATQFLADSAVNVRDIAPRQNPGVVFVDAMKQAEQWTSREPLLLDEAGNVRFLAPGQVAETVIYRRGAYPSGNYTLLYSGNGKFDFNGNAEKVVSLSRGRIVLRVTPSSAGLRLRLTATDPREPVHDVRLILPGFAESYTRAPFHPLFVQALRAFHVLCFKDWMHSATFVSSTVWPDRPQVWRATQVAPAGVAPEYMVALANASGANPWFTLPVGATDMYIYQFAALVHQTLDPRLRATFEYGYEAWKPGTPGNAYAAMAGRNFHLAVDPDAAARAWYTMRSAQMFSLVKRAFGDDAGRASFVLDAVVVAAAPHPVSRDALERFSRRALAQGYMPSPPPPAVAPSAPPLPLAAECRSPQCARLPPADRANQQLSPALSAQQRHRTAAGVDDRPPDYRT